MTDRLSLAKSYFINNMRDLIVASAKPPRDMGPLSVVCPSRCGTVVGGPKILVSTRVVFEVNPNNEK